VETILSLQHNLETFQAEVQDLEAQLLGPRHMADSVEFTIQLNECRAKCNRFTLAIQRHRKALGVDDRLKLERLKNNVYLRIRMNALAVKHRLRGRIRQRKFEIEKLERAYRRTVNGEFFLVLLFRH
jgi:hypothetical protein